MCNWSNVPIKTEVIQEDVTTPKIEADIKPKVEPCDEISNVNNRAEIQKWINQIEFKIEADVKPKIEADIKPKIEVDIKPKIESSDENEEINNGMEVISSMNFPVAAEIQAQYIFIFKDSIGSYRSVNLRTNLWCLQFPKNATKYCQDFCPSL